jgi:ferredoxin
MENGIYRQLQQYLHQLPCGFPEGPKGTDIALLKTMYTPEEAALCLRLTPEGQTAEAIALSHGGNVDTIRPMLDAMATRGLLFRIRIQETPHYVLMPYVVGTFEFQLNRLSPEYNKAHNRYMMDAMGMEVFGGKTSQFRILPVEAALEDTQTIMPHEKIRRYIEEARLIAVSDCLCRKKAQAEGRGCDHTLKACLSLNEFAEFYLEAGMPTEIISKEAALKLMEDCEKEGLVAHTQNAKDEVCYICNCCVCSCGIFSTVARFNLHSQIVRASWQCRIDPEACTACAACMERCIFNALSPGENGKMEVSRGKCMGCGLCKSACPSEAISLVQREKRFQPDVPADPQEMYDRMQAEKNRPLRMLSMKSLKARVSEQK